MTESWWTIRRHHDQLWLSSIRGTGTTTHYQFSSSPKDALSFPSQVAANRMWLKLTNSNPGVHFEIVKE